MKSEENKKLTDEELAQRLVNLAYWGFEQENGPNEQTPVPNALLNLDMYPDNNIENVKKELEKLEFDLVDIKDAPHGFNVIKLRNTMIAYKK